MDQYLPKRRPRSVNWLEEDKKLLTVLVCEKIEIIENKSTKTNVNLKKASAWEEILQRFNAKCNGVTRTTDQIKIQWKQLKIIAKNSNPNFYEQIKNCSITSLPMTYKNAQAVADGIDSTLDSESKSDSSEENALAFLKSKKGKNKRSYYLEIHNCCVALITEHGRPAELLDDLAFRRILTRVPMKDVERSKLTSSFIKECINDGDLWSPEGSDEDDDDFDDDDHDSNDKTDDGDDNAPLKNEVKKEREECSCPSRDTGSHMTGCPAVAQDTDCHFINIKTEPKEHTSKTNENIEVSFELDRKISHLKEPPNKKIKFHHDKRKIDAFDAFGKSVAMQLKSLSESNALLAQSQIQTTLTEFGMKDIIKNKRLNKNRFRNETSRCNFDDEDSLNGTEDSLSRSYLKYRLSSK